MLDFFRQILSAGGVQAKTGRRKLNQITPEPAASVIDAVHARLLRFFPEVTEALGGRPEALLAQAGITPAPIAGGTRRG